MKNIVNNNILDNSNNILDLNAIENIVINNTNTYYNNIENLLNLDNIEMPLVRSIPQLTRQNAFNNSD